MEFDEVIEKLLDKDNYDNIFLYSDEGDALELEQIATVPLNEQIYVILHPIDDEIPDDAAFVFHVNLEEEMISFVEDEDIYNLVFDKYYESIEEDDE